MKIPLPGPLRQTASPLKGVLFILVGTLFFSAMALVTRAERGVFRVESLVFYRMALQTLALAPFAIRYFRAPLGATLKMHFPRAIAGTLSMASLYGALSYLPVAAVTLLGMSSVGWSTLFAAWWLKEHTTRKEVAWGLLACGGLALSVLPLGEEAGRWALAGVGIAIGLLYGLSMGIAATAIKGLRRSHGAVEIVFFFGFIGVVLALPFFVRHPELPKDFAGVRALVLIAGLGTIAQLLMTTGFKYTSTFTATLINLQQAFFNTLFAHLLLEETPPVTFLLGTTVVVSGIVGLVRSRRVKTLDSPSTS